MEFQSQQTSWHLFEWLTSESSSVPILVALLYNYFSICQLHKCHSVRLIVLKWVDPINYSISLTSSDNTGRCMNLYTQAELNNNRTVNQRSFWLISFSSLFIGPSLTKDSYFLINLFLLLQTNQISISRYTLSPIFIILFCYLVP